MNFQQLLREEHYLLKNQITELKNAFDINRDILAILTKHDSKSDPQHLIFLKIISKLTSINNQGMMNSLELMQEKNTLKAEIYRLNDELNRLEQRLNHEIENNNKTVNSPTDARLLLHQQFNKLNRQLLAFNQERIAYEQEIAYWKQKCIAISTQFKKKQQIKGQSQIEEIKKLEPYFKKSKIKRKYTSNENVKNDWLVYQQQKQIRRLNQVIEQLENRLELIIKAHNLQEEVMRKKQQKMKYKSQWNKDMEQIGLLKYALNVIAINQKADGLYMSITHRFKQQRDPKQKRKRVVHSWPKYKQFDYQIALEEKITTLNTDDDSK